MKKERDRRFISYWELSYKGKFIRTLWMVPVAVVAILFLLIIGSSFVGFPRAIIYSLFLLALLIAQLIYNYIKWKDPSNTE